MYEMAWMKWQTVQRIVTTIVIIWIEKKGNFLNALPRCQGNNAKTHRQVTMVKTFQAYLPNKCHRTYSCVHCRAHLANHDELISKVRSSILFLSQLKAWSISIMTMSKSGFEVLGFQKKLNKKLFQDFQIKNSMTLFFVNVINMFTILDVRCFHGQTFHTNFIIFLVEFHLLCSQTLSIHAFEEYSLSSEKPNII